MAESKQSGIDPLTGRLAEFATRQRQTKQTPQQTDLQIQQTEELRLGAAERAGNHFWASAVLLLRATLLVTGFYFYRGTLRRRHRMPNRTPTVPKKTTEIREKHEQGQAHAQRSGAPNPDINPPLASEETTASASTERPVPTILHPLRRPPHPEKAREKIQPISEREESRPSPNPPLSPQENLGNLVESAQAGSPEALKALCELLKQSPEIWQHVGDLGRHAERVWIELISHESHLLRESAKRYLVQWKSDLEGPTPAPLEKLLIQEIVLSWLAKVYAELEVARPGKTTSTEMNQRLRRLESAQKRLLNAIKTLESLRTVPEVLCDPRTAASRGGPL